jgi:hypothetical protein
MHVGPQASAEQLCIKYGLIVDRMVNIDKCLAARPTVAAAHLSGAITSSASQGRMCSRTCPS